MFQRLRPDLLVAKVTGYSWYIEDPAGGPAKEPPPRLLDPDAELITIDEYLGIYLPAERKLKIFCENIRMAAEMLGCREHDLKYLVRYHEQAHTVIHLGVPHDHRLKSFQDADFKTLKLQELTETFVAVEPTLHEHLAQLVTFHILRDLFDVSDNEMVKDAAHRMLDAFTKLMQRQPPAYRVEPYLDVSLERVRGSIHLIKNRSLVGRLEPWKQLMQWK